MSSDPVSRLQELRAKIDARKAAMNGRVSDILSKSGDEELPPFEELQDERERLSVEIQSKKEEVDAAVQQLQGLNGISDLFRVGARAQRFEDFAQRASAFAADDVSSEAHMLNETGTCDPVNEEAACCASLPDKYKEEMDKINALKKKTKKCAEHIKYSPKLSHGTKNMRSAFKTVKSETPDKETENVINYISDAVREKEELFLKVKDLRQRKSKLQVELLDEKHRNEKRVNELKTCIRQAELTNEQNVRACQQLNTGNAALTTNSQILLGQLNVEHYGMGDGPTEQMLIQERKEMEKCEANERKYSNGNNGNGEPLCLVAANPTDGASYVSSRRQSSSSKPPLVAIKSTQAQRNRVAALRADLERRQEEGAAGSRHHSPHTSEVSRNRRNSFHDY